MLPQLWVGDQQALGSAVSGLRAVLAASRRGAAPGGPPPRARAGLCPLRLGDTAAAPGPLLGVLSVLATPWRGAACLSRDRHGKLAWL